jgi:regulator of sigma E protease
MSVNGEDIGTFDELRRIIAKNPSKPLRLKVFRDKRHVEVEVTPDTVELRELDIVDRVGTLGIQSSAPAAVIGVPSAESPAYRAGLRTFDVITNIGGVPIRRFMDVQRVLGENAGETLPITYLRPVTVPNALGGLADMAVLESGVVALTPDPAGTSLLERTGVELADLYVAIIPEDSYLAKAGLRAGDKIVKLDEEEVPAWSTFLERVLRDSERAHRVDYLRASDGRVHSGTFQVRREAVLQMQHWIPLAPDERVEPAAPIRYALTKAVENTLSATRFLFVGIVRIIEGKISLRELSGPLTIYEVAGEEGRKGPDHFIWVMALISINLGLLNLLPIPVLDGGHLMFFALEGVMRRPLPLRVRELAHIVGMAILFCLILLAFKNDIDRRRESAPQHEPG